MLRLTKKLEFKVNKTIHTHCPGGVGGQTKAPSTVLGTFDPVSGHTSEPCVLRHGQKCF